MPPQYYIIAATNIVGCAVSLLLWLWHWRRTRRANALYLYGTQVLVLVAACVFLARSPGFSGAIESRLFYGMLPGCTAWAIAPLLIERRILQWAVSSSRRKAFPPPVKGNWRDVAFIFLFTAAGAAYVLGIQSWLLKFVPPGVSDAYH